MENRQKKKLTKEKVEPKGKKCPNIKINDDDAFPAPL
jgi:hypothetical protein